MDVIIKHSFRFLSVGISTINSIKNGDNKKFIATLNLCCERIKAIVVGLIQAYGDNVF